jgi:hypothetical protein
MAAEVQRGCRMVMEKPQSEHREAQRGLEILRNTTEMQQNSVREVQRGCRMVMKKPQSGHREAQRGLERLQNSDKKITERIHSDYRDATERLKSGTPLAAHFSALHNGVIKSVVIKATFSGFNML